MTQTRNTSPLFDAETERLIRQLTGDEYSAEIWDAENALRARIRQLIEQARARNPADV